MNPGKPLGVRREKLAEAGVEVSGMNSREDIRAANLGAFTLSMPKLLPLLTNERQAITSCREACRCLGLRPGIGSSG